MMKYAASRMLLALPTILISLFMIFFMIRLIPGDPAQIILGDVDDAGALQRIRAKLGLDEPLIVQFLLWLRAISGGDFGRSIALDSPVGDLLFSSFSSLRYSSSPQSSLRPCLPSRPGCSRHGATTRIPTRRSWPPPRHSSPFQASGSG